VTAHSNYRELFDAAAHSPAAKDFLPKLKIAAIEQFEAVGFPTTRDEDWHFTSVSPIAERIFRPVRSTATALTAEDIARFTYGQDDWHLLVFVNGRYEPALSSFAQLDVDAQVMSSVRHSRKRPSCSPNASAHSPRRHTPSRR
jgi:Fe-S cluster assembly protein SufD